MIPWNSKVIFVIDTSLDEIRVASVQIAKVPVRKFKVEVRFELTIFYSKT